MLMGSSARAVAVHLLGALSVLVAGLWLVVGTSCFDAPSPECAFLCGADDACPDDYSCRPDGWCKHTGVDDNFACAPASFDAAVNEDASAPDAEVADADPGAPDAGANGADCGGDNDCASGHCVDDVCCDTACDMACETCVASAGATADGTCSPRTDALECRASGGPCDIAETCNGTARTCPSDAVRDTNFVCDNTTSGLCDVVDTCDGTNKTCPEEVEPVNTECRAAINAECDTAEVCDGSSQNCPSDTTTTAGTQCTDTATDDCDDAQCDGNGQCVQDHGVEAGTYECRPSAGECDVAETCNGSTGGACGTDLFVGMGTQCTDSSTDDCNDAQCDGSGACSQTGGFEADGTTCNVDGGDTCCSNTCIVAGGTCP